MNEIVWSNEQIVEIKRRLNNRIEEKHKERESLSSKLGAIAPDNSLGRITRMDAINQQAMDKANFEKAKKQIQVLKKCLESLDSSPQEFGFCRECEEPIEWQRLLLVPEGQKCLECMNEV